MAHDVISGLYDKAQEGERVDATLLRQIVEESYDQPVSYTHLDVYKRQVVYLYASP